MNRFEVFALIATLIGLVTILGVTYWRDACRELPEFDDEPSIRRHHRTVDALGCASGFHDWRLRRTVDGEPVWVCSTCTHVHGREGVS